jgi:HemY protein
MPEVVLAGAMAFQAAGDYKEATKVLESALGDGSAPVVKQDGGKASEQQVGQDQVFNARLLMAYARAETEQVTARLQKAEQWLAKRKQVREQEARTFAARKTSSAGGAGGSAVGLSGGVSGGLSVSYADLLTTLGSLCLAAQLWGQAQRYLEQSAKLRKDARVHALLDSLFDRIGQPQRAALHWRLATAVSAALPTLAQDAKLSAADTHADPVIPHGEGLGDFDGEAAGEQGEQYLVEPTPSMLAAKTPDASAYDEFFDSAPVTLPADAYPAEDERKVAK